jgi:hypothetical protein
MVRNVVINTAGIRRTRQRPPKTARPVLHRVHSTPVPRLMVGSDPCGRLRLN